MSSAEQQLSANLPAPKTFAPSREDVLSTLGFFFGDPGTRSRPLEPKGHGTLCNEVFVKLPSRSDLCLVLVCRVSFLTAVPEKLKVPFTPYNTPHTEAPKTATQQLTKPSPP
jgi:hypothetical protein